MQRPQDNNMSDDPFTLFDIWYQDAVAREPRDPNAMCLATVGENGFPSARMVLLKGYDTTGFTFFTNCESRKGEHIKLHNKVALCFHWKSMNRQIRIEGLVELVSAQEADAYYATRPRGSQIGAWASAQSRPLDTPETLIARVAEFEKKFDSIEKIPRPPHWSGYKVIPLRIEFWEDRPFRLHHRALYVQDNNNWTQSLLYP